ncbi:MAG: hypothetical protein P8018_09195 [Acidobacteriota bacterium]|jgi:hypothetical protein
MNFQKNRDVNDRIGFTAPPRAVKWIAAEAALFSIAALVVSALVHARFYGASDSSATPGSVLDPVLSFCVIALCWGALGASVNAVLALAKHCADRDFREEWNWWYFSKPPLGAVTGLTAFILMRGLGSLMGDVNVGGEISVAAVAFVAGFATERVMHKIEDISKTMFATKGKETPLVILEPQEGQVLEDEASVIAQTQGEATFVSAGCKEVPGGTAELDRSAGGLFRGRISLNRDAPKQTIYVAAVIGGKTYTKEVAVQRKP